jgi:glycogen debranching enzyme
VTGPDPVDPVDPARACEPRADGILVGRGGASLALAGPRLLAKADGRGVHDVTVWGGGRIGGMRLPVPVPHEAEALVEPGRLTFAWPGHELSVTALQDAPAILLRHRGDGLRVAPQGGGGVPAGFEEEPPAVRRDEAEGWRVEAPWAVLRAYAPGAARDGRALRLPAGEAHAWLIAGEHEDEVEAALARLCADPAGVTAAHDAWVAELRDRFEVDDPELRSLVVHGLANALASRKELAGGVFAGHAAGHRYAEPARSYYRDGYWTVQALLPFAPERAVQQLRFLARGVDDEGRAPSAVIATSAAGMRAWRARRASDPELARSHPRNEVWWPDHADSPSLYVLLARDAAAWSGADELLREEVDGASHLTRMGWVADGLLRRRDARGLPQKPPHDRDWADNVFRGGAVTYDVALAYGALRAAADAWLGEDRARADAWREAAAGMRAAAETVLWDEAAGHFREFVQPDGRSPGTLAIDTLAALRFGLADEMQARASLGAVRARLETRNDARQPYGDWGVSCLRPGYPDWVPRRGKALFPYRYHNGSDWPYWDGVYAEQLLTRGDPGWRYPLLRWWSYGLARGRTTPVEYQSPPWGAGSAATGWSSMPAAAVLLGGFGLTPRGRPTRPPWGDSVLRDVTVGGRPATLVVQGHALEVRRHAE